MEKDNHIQHREVIERYCNVIDENTALFLICENEGVKYRCLRERECCDEKGACTNKKYNPSNL